MEIYEAELVPVASSLRASKWSTPVLITGLGSLLFYCLLVLFGAELHSLLPPILLYPLLIVFPNLYFILFPLITRNQDEPNQWQFPGWKQIFWEAIISIPLILLCLVLSVVTEQAISYFFHASNLNASAFNQGIGETGTLSFYFLFLMAIYAPLGEEIFFRGFLFNAFRSRMPLALAVIVQTGIFAALHFYNFTYIIAVIPLGLVLTLIYLWRKTIITAIFVHSGYNSLAAIGFLLAMQAAANQAVLGVSPQIDASECVISIVYPGSPAAIAGIIPGDTITQLDKYEIKEFQDLLHATTYFNPGDKVVIVLLRDGEQIITEATFVSRKTLRSNLNQAPQP